MRAWTSALALLFVAAAASAAAQTAPPQAEPTGAPTTPTAAAGRTWANPLDLDYAYATPPPGAGVSYRNGSDPAVVLHRDRYYLFATDSRGYWTSRDLKDWRFVTPRGWPDGALSAPAAVSDGEALYLLSAGPDPRPLLSSKTPDTGVWTAGGRPVVAPEGGLWSPDLFIDADDVWFLQQGWSDVRPLTGGAVDPAAGLVAAGPTRPLATLDPSRYGWQRFGQDHSGGLPDGTPVRPFIDGAGMMRSGGRYYLQFAAPGVEYNAAATGVAVAASASGPFEVAPWSPVSYKPGGFMQGAGHGAAFQDRYGNWWNAATSRIGLNWTFERRISMFPGGLHDDGQMWFSSRFGDFPQRMPNGPVTSADSLFTGWMPLSYRAKAVASSTLGTFSADRATDEDPRTYWVAANREAGQTLTLDLGGVKTVQAVQVNYADHEAGVSGDMTGDAAGDASAGVAGRRTRFSLLWSTDGETWTLFASRMTADRDSPHAYVEGDRPVQARYIRYRHGEAPGAHLALADLRVFGNGPGEAPTAPQNLRVSRGEDQRNAVVRIDLPDPDAKPAGRLLGYNVRWGLAPDRLHLTYQVWADDLAALGGEVEIRALNVGVDYHFAVESFGEAGVSALSEIVAAPAGVVTAPRTGDAAPLGQPQPTAPGPRPASGVRVTPIPPVYISGAPPVTGRDLPPAGTPGADGTTAAEDAAPGATPDVKAPGGATPEKPQPASPADPAKTPQSPTPG